MFVLRSCETVRKETAADTADGRRRERIRMHRPSLDALVDVVVRHRHGVERGSSRVSGDENYERN